MSQLLDEESSENTPHSIRAYDWTFGVIYSANLLLMLSLSLMFRYADFVSISGGDEAQLGLIVGVGTLGSLGARLYMGSSIDRYGARVVWLCSLVLYSVGILVHAGIDSASSPWVYVARIVMQCGFAGAIGASLTFVSLRVPAHRVAEIIGVIGSAGFLGMAVGPTIGDWLFQSETITRQTVNLMFYCSASAGGLSFILTWIATYHHQRGKPTHSPKLIKTLRQYHPGFILIVGAAMGLGLSLPGIFLRPYAISKGIADIHLFFWTYNLVAFLVRLLTARLNHRIGLRNMMHVGMSCLALSMPLYLCVSQGNEYSLVIPAAMAGMAHALLFPTVIACGGSAFPNHLRGTATALMLGMFDIGILIGSPIVGGLIDFTPKIGLAAYPATFITVGILFAGVGIVNRFSMPKNIDF